MSDTEADEQVDTQILRTRLESADTALAHAMIRRWQAGEAAWTYARGAAVFDPAEQARRLRRFSGLVAARGGPADAISRAWRNLLGDQLARSLDGPIVIAGLDEAETRAARDYFGTGPALDVLSSQRAVLTHLSARGDTIGCLPWPRATGHGRWWAMLNESVYAGLNILGCWPFGAPAIAVVGSGPILPSGSDDMLAIAHDDLRQSGEVFASVGLAARVVARVRSLALCSLDGYIEAGDQRLNAARAEGLEGFRLIGVAQKP